MGLGASGEPCMIRTKKRILLCGALIALNLGLIWGNSLATGTESGRMSGQLMQLLMALLRIPESWADTFHLLIRKAAHFTEFACLGLLLCWMLGMSGERGWHLWALPVLLGMAAACADETIQVFVPDRGPSLIDVWIDTCGAAAGMTVLRIGHHLIRKTRE